MSMHVEYLRLRNFRAFQDVEFRNLPRFCILLLRQQIKSYP